MFIDVVRRKYQGKYFYAATMRVDRYTQFTAYGDTKLEAVEKLPDMLLFYSDCQKRYFNAGVAHR